MITPALLIQLCPQLDPLRATDIANALEAAAIPAQITTRPRVAAFIAQLAHESMGFYYTEEVWGKKPTKAQASYQGRLGNTRPGDGYRYRGRGWIQLTGRANYRAMGAILSLPLEANPDLASKPDVAALTACAYWTQRKINDPADARDFVEVTKRVNGGTNGIEDRTAYYRRALDLLMDVSAPPASEGQDTGQPGAVLPLYGVAGFDRVRILKRTDGEGLKAYGVPVGKELE